MGKKKGKKSGKKGKGKKGKKSAKGSKKLDPAVLKAIADADTKAVEDRKKCVAGVVWVDTLRDWFEHNRAQTFDVLRRLDAQGVGYLPQELFAEGLRKTSCPLKPEEIETLAEAVDFEGNNQIDYCRRPQLLRCYGGGLHELIERGLERVKMNHRQDLQEIDELHAAKVAELSGVKPPGGDNGENIGASPAAGGEADGGHDLDNDNDGGDGDGDVNDDNGDDGDGAADEDDDENGGPDDDGDGGGDDDEDDGDDGDDGDDVED